MNQRSRNGNSLHLAARELMRHAMRQVGQIHRGKTFHCSWTGPHPAGKEKGKLDVLNDAQSVQQLKRLEDNADFFTAKGGQLRFVELIGDHAVKADLSAGREIHGAGEMQQSRLAASAAADERNELTGPDLKRHPIECTDRSSVGDVVLHYMLQRQQRTRSLFAIRSEGWRRFEASFVHVDIY
jgi:hypothetical protein